MFYTGAQVPGVSASGRALKTLKVGPGFSIVKSVACGSSSEVKTQKMVYLKHHNHLRRQCPPQPPSNNSRLLKVMQEPSPVWAQVI